MPYPSVTALPMAPSRVGDPTNFGAEAALFLGALPTWRTQSNALASYVSTAPLNIWNWGTVVDVNPMQVLLTALTALPTTPGLAWALSQDALGASLQSASALENSFGAYVDAVGVLTGNAVDPDRVSASLVSAAPLRGQTQSVFNTTSGTFYQSAQTHVSGLNNVSNYFYLAISPDNYGLIGEAITETDDWGIL